MGIQQLIHLRVINHANNDSTGLFAQRGRIDVNHCTQFLESRGFIWVDVMDMHGKPKLQQTSRDRASHIANADYAHRGGGI